MMEFVDITPDDADTFPMCARTSTGRGKIPKPLKKYQVLVDGRVIGIVEQRLETFERRPYRGARYVTKRWQSPRWFSEFIGERAYYRGGHMTRKSAATAMIFREIRKDEAVDFAHSA